ncbi:MAG: hypothetical protein QOE14_1382, partial [Humisphaera sp.]|nr:hypothetical protein [Humisphaera sp.]
MEGVARRTMEGEESEVVMERLISLFREPDYESPPQPSEQPPPERADEEPLYFKQLLEYLRARKENGRVSQRQRVVRHE